MTTDAAITALLALSARPRMPADLARELHQRAGRVERWDEALAAAERHGVAPLLYHHLKTHRIPTPPAVAPQLGALYVRHRRANAARLAALGEILNAFDARGLPARVLKGPALMTLVYGDPALRPISDLDLLLPRGDVLRGQQILRDIGFSAPPPRSMTGVDRHHHLRAATRNVDGVLVQVELHHHALSQEYDAPMAFEDCREPPLAFDVGGRQALTLGPHEMLQHLSRHLLGPLPRPMRLIWVADVFGCAEAFAERLDWASLAHRQPAVLNVLAVANSLTPLPDAVRSHIPTAILRGFADFGLNASAWTWLPPQSEPGGKRTRVRRAINPPHWWLALQYGRHGRPQIWRSRLRHLAVLARVAYRRAPTGFKESGPG